MKKEIYIKELEAKVIALTNKSKDQETNIKQLHTFIQKFTHDIKNPIGTMFSFSEMINEDFEEYTSEKLKKHLKIIQDTANTSIKILNDSNSYTQLLNSENNFDFEKINYTDFLKNVTTDLAPLASLKNNKLKIEISDSSLFLTVDSYQIEQAITKIVDNAFRFSKENTTVTIQLKENYDSIETIITDNGIGVSKENKYKIFEAFFTEKTYSLDNKKCNGLGLAIAEKIISLHKGTIKLIIKEGKGSQFCISLPKANK